MSLKPMYDNIVIKPVKVDEKTAGGIYLGNDRGQHFAEGEVIAIGAGYRVNGEIVPLVVKVGDNVVYRKGVEVPLTDDNGDEVLVLSEATILAIK